MGLSFKISIGQKTAEINFIEKLWEIDFMSSWKIIYMKHVYLYIMVLLTYFSTGTCAIKGLAFLQFSIFTLFRQTFHLSHMKIVFSLGVAEVFGVTLITT